MNMYTVVTKITARPALLAMHVGPSICINSHSVESVTNGKLLCVHVFGCVCVLEGGDHEWKISFYFYKCL